MLRSLHLLTAAGLLAGWLSLGMVSPPAGTASFVLEAPAAYVSVGQEFNPRIVNHGADGEFTAEVRDAAGQLVWHDEAMVAADENAWLTVVSLPRAGSYQLRARQEDASGAWQSQPVTAVPEPGSDIGGVVGVAAADLDAGVSQYLDAHGFAVSPLQPGATPRVILMGDARLDAANGAARADEYRILWSQVAEGAHLLALGPPPPGVAADWPDLPPLVAGGAGCAASVFPLEAPELAAGLEGPGTGALLSPAVRYAASARLTLYRLDGGQIFKWDAEPCPAFLTFRLGDGWVTVTTLPLLGNFQDTRARRYLMNLVAAVGRRGHAAPPARGLALVLQQGLDHLPPQPTLTAAAAGFFEPPPAALIPAQVWAPALTDDNPASCMIEPVQHIGAAAVLNLRPALAGSTLKLNLGSDPRRWPRSAELEGSPDGVHWKDVGALGTPAADGSITIALPTGAWEDLRLRLTADAAQPWAVCEMSLGS